MAGDRWVVVTGASRGIGRAVSERLAGDGWRVALVARGATALSALASSLGDGALAVPCDVTSRDASREAMRLLARAGCAAPDAFVHAAGAFALAPVGETPPEAMRQMLDLHIGALEIWLGLLLPDMRERRHGSIVALGSVADRAIFPENGAYAASKFGARALLDVARAELRGSGVRLTLLSPGPVDTPLWDPIDPDHRPGFLPRAKMLPAGAVADAVAWVLSRPAGVAIDEVRLSPNA